MFLSDKLTNETVDDANLHILQITMARMNTVAIKKRRKTKEGLY
jgi:hypothetical protein